jgi:hypothetical protein
MLAADVIVDVADIRPPVNKLPPVTLPVAVIDPAFTDPVTLTLVPVAAPMFGVVKLALGLTVILLRQLRVVHAFE